MDQPLLSICIPTYNRSKFLAELLDSIVSQFAMRDIHKYIEIIISDNASVDDTTATVEAYQKKYKNIYYYKNESNIGAPRNVCFALNQGTGKYLWVIGDDDIFAPFALDQVLSKLKDEDYGAVLLNFSQGEYKNPNIIMLKNCLHIHKDKSYTDFKHFFDGEDFKNFFGINFLSAIIFNREQFQKNAQNTNKYLDTCYYQSYAFLYSARVGKLLRLATPIVIWRSWERERRYDNVQPNDDHIFNTYIAYIEKAKDLGYEYDISKLALIKKRQVFLLENFIVETIRRYVIEILDFFHLKKIVKKIYRVPRVLRYTVKKYE